MRHQLGRGEAFGRVGLEEGGHERFGLWGDLGGGWVRGKEAEKWDKCETVDGEEEGTANGDCTPFPTPRRQIGLFPPSYSVGEGWGCEG